MSKAPEAEVSKHPDLVVHALRTRQTQKDIFAFFIPGGKILQVADIERLSRTAGGRLKGFQRTEIRQHVKSIVAYLNHPAVIFPNAIILAISPEVKFIGSRGPERGGALPNTDAGYLTLPIRPKGERVAWIVDGQQRSIALEETANGELPIPVIAFVCDDIETQREQFILVNKARPLPHRLIDELLPVTAGVLLPQDLASRRVPSKLCDTLSRDKNSPFYELVRRPSMDSDPARIVQDSALTQMIRARINNPLGALAPFKSLGEGKANTQRMYEVLVAYWSAVKTVFPKAWGKPPTKSRLMHSAGINAMGVLMDRIVSRLGSTEDLEAKARTELRKIEAKCAWTEGTWPIVHIQWNAIESTPRGIKTLSDVLVRMYSEVVR
jgi:DGQHR domain-containing protein